MAPISKFMLTDIPLYIAADPRARPTDYGDDQTWQVNVGHTPDDPALAIQTRYGGRVGLLRIVPIMSFSGQPSYEVGQLQSNLTVPRLASNLVQVEAAPWANDIEVSILIWAIDSHTLGGRFSFHNRSTSSQDLSLALYLQAMNLKEELPLQHVEVSAPKSTLHGLNVQKAGDLQPILLLEGGRVGEGGQLTCQVTLAKGQKAALHFVHAAYPTLNDSLKAAYRWLDGPSWKEALAQDLERSQQLPTIEFNDEGLDKAILLSQVAVMRSVIGPTEMIDHPTPVFVRSPSTGYTPNPDGPAEALRTTWAGMAALDTYHWLSSLAVLDPPLAQEVFLNWLERQQPTGQIDGFMGGGDQYGNYNLLPILAQLAEIIYQYSQDADFLKTAWPYLMRFYYSWWNSDVDRDGFPEWKSVNQANYQYHPIASLTASGSIPIGIEFLESPDLAAYLLREGEAIARLATIVGDSAIADWARIEPRANQLSNSLQKNWQEGRFYYRDRDTNSVLKGQSLFTVKGDEAITQPFDLPLPNRLVILCDSSTTHRPTSLRATIKGYDLKGKAVTEELPKEQFAWYRTTCAATSNTVWQRVESIKVEGLSRVYRYEIQTVDLSRQDISLFLPYISRSIPEEQRDTLASDLEKLFLHDYGLSSLPKTDPFYEHPNSNAMLTVPTWQLMLGMEFLMQGLKDFSNELFWGQASAIVQNLTLRGQFYQWYHAETGTGLGTPEMVTGTISLHWLIQLVGVYVHHSGMVQLLGRYNFNKKNLRMTWHGVKIARTASKLKIKFPSGHTLELPNKAEPQFIQDPNYVPIAPKPPKPPKASPPPSASKPVPPTLPTKLKTVKIKLDPPSE